MESQQQQLRALERYRGHRFKAEAVARGGAWQGLYRTDFMLQPAAGHTLGPRQAESLDSCWSTPTEAVTHAAELAHAAIDAYERLAGSAAAVPDSGLRDQRLTLCYSLLAEDGVERQRSCADPAEVLEVIHSLEPGLRHAFVLDAAGTVLLEAGIDDRAERERTDHADWPQTE